MQYIAWNGNVIFFNGFHLTDFICSHAGSYTHLLTIYTYFCILGQGVYIYGTILLENAIKG